MSYSQLSTEARNVVAMFTQATTLEVEQGCQWYSEAHQIAYKLGKRFGLYTDQVAGVIAALSPLNKWERNVLNAETMLKAWTYGTPEDAFNCSCSTPDRNKEKAVRILHSTETLEPHEEILNGPKVIEFYNCIVKPEVNDVCIDGHAYCIFMGIRLALKDVPAIGKRLRQRIKQDYRDATAFINEELGETYLASQIQAITWVTYKRIHNV
tara:strand:- start:3631 stop:4260 length:630 start_codon:yes stop_codon:yes gene_type:complete